MVEIDVERILQILSLQQPELAQALRAYRAEHLLLQREMAQALGVTHLAYHQWERNSTPKFVTRRRIRDRLRNR
jgi:DNA-binding XRE family transcriptional regulator